MLHWSCFAPNKSQKSPSIGKKCPEGRKVIKPNEVEGTHRIASVSVFSGLVCKVSTSSSTIYIVYTLTIFWVIVTLFPFAKSHSFGCTYIVVDFAMIGRRRLIRQTKSEPPNTDWGWVVFVSSLHLRSLSQFWKKNINTHVHFNQ